MTYLNLSTSSPIHFLAKFNILRYLLRKKQTLGFQILVLEVFGPQKKIYLKHPKTPSQEED